MKFTLSWLKKHLATKAGLAEICDTLTAIGLEVESVSDRASALAAFKVARVVEAKPHPNADRLKVCNVETAEKVVQVVCGAPNARAGMMGIFAPPGTFIPGTAMELKAGTIRGEASNGMLLSERELGLSDTHGGIVEVADKWPVGTPVAEVFGLNDPVIEINLTPNRGDCAGVRGIARDLAAAGLGELLPLDIRPLKSSYKSPIGVKIEDAAACPLFIGRYIRGVKNGPSPAWLQNALKAIGLRPISVLVDITNYLTFDLARPLHVFDADKVKGDLRVHLAKGGETMLALNDKSYTAEAGMTLISVGDSLESFGGIIGGAGTGCHEATTNVFLETALFDPVRTAATGRKLNISTDARYRFERGLDPAMVKDYSELATRLIIELCGGEASEPIIVGHAPDTVRSYSLGFTRVETLGGISVERAEQESILTALGFAVKAGREGWMVSPPSWRPDIQGEADLVEEVLRIRGYDEIPATPLPRLATLPNTVLTKRHALIMKTRRALAARGLSEAVTYSFVNSKSARHFGELAPALMVINPIASDLDVMRNSGFVTLLEAAVRNSGRGFADVALFEIGPVFSAAENDLETQVITTLRTAKDAARHWSKATHMLDVFDAKADALSALETLGVKLSSLQTTSEAPDYFHPYRAGCLKLGDVVLANFGEIHPNIRLDMGLKGVAVGAEIFLARLPEAKRSGHEKPALVLSPFQPLARDFAFVVPADMPAQTLVKAVMLAERNLIADVAVFDDYAMPDGQKSLALGVTLQPSDKTLTEGEIEVVMQKIITAAEKAGAELRK
jgi:phenylalanyl-tRNA synthetase beta chain